MAKFILTQYTFKCYSKIKKAISKKGYKLFNNEVHNDFFIIYFLLFRYIDITLSIE